MDNCITAFRYKPILALTKKDKILFVITSMDRKIQELWNCYEKNHDIHTLKWDDFTTFLKDILEMPIHCNQTIATRYKKAHVVPPPQESMDNGPSLFDYGLDNSYNDLIDDFDPYLEYGEGYQNRTAFEDAFYG